MRNTGIGELMGFKGGPISVRTRVGKSDLLVGFSCTKTNEYDL